MRGEMMQAAVIASGDGDLIEASFNIYFGIRSTPSKMRSALGCEMICSHLVANEVKCLSQLEEHTRRSETQRQMRCLTHSLGIDVNGHES